MTTLYSSIACSTIPTNCLAGHSPCRRRRRFGRSYRKTQEYRPLLPERHQHPRVPHPLCRQRPARGLACGRPGRNVAARRPRPRRRRRTPAYRRRRKCCRRAGAHRPLRSAQGRIQGLKKSLRGGSPRSNNEQDLIARALIHIGGSQRHVLAQRRGRLLLQQESGDGFFADKDLLRGRLDIGGRYFIQTVRPVEEDAVIAEHFVPSKHRRHVFHVG